MKLSDFHFDLPNELIARYPVTQRSASRLLQAPNAKHALVHRHFYDIVDLLNPGDLLVFNNTKVIPARLFGQKTTGGQAEILVERVLDTHRILAQVRVSKPPRMGDNLIFADNIRLKVLNKQNQFYELCYEKNDRTILDVIELIGHIPLPPYMHREAEESDKERYQTIYAEHKGSVAAPTAGLHFDAELMQALQAKQVDMAYLMLHVGAGTFAPIRTQNIREHKMHAEYIEVSAELCARINATKARGNRVIAVGTTSMRALETASQSGTLKSYAGDTSIFIYPGYQFNCVDALITNFHLPASTLLMLVCAFGGYEEVMKAYREAVAQSYRFFSYGDAMWVEKA